MAPASMRFIFFPADKQENASLERMNESNFSEGSQFKDKDSSDLMCQCQYEA